eukprot:GEMP01014934.1.p1 GENE.GEMP01014934.1~~GEMP01014934.1.p1  ORF type:complete len:698 (+),score=120.05 GEMP01014934.1:72-2165(+)
MRLQLTIMYSVVLLVPSIASPGCPPSTIENMLTCLDGTQCKYAATDTWSCCLKRGGRAQCPSHVPFMCRWKACSGGRDYCCSSTAASCGIRGGLIRSCPKKCKNDTECVHPSAPKCVDNVCAECDNDASCTDESKPKCIHNVCVVTCGNPAHSCSKEMPIKRNFPSTITCPESGCTDAICCVECQRDEQCTDPSKSRCAYNVCAKSYHYENLGKGKCVLQDGSEVRRDFRSTSDAPSCQFGCDARPDCRGYSFVSATNGCHLYTSAVDLKVGQVDGLIDGHCMAKRDSTTSTTTTAPVTDTEESFKAGKTKCRKNCLMLCGGEGPGSFQQECTNSWCKEARSDYTEDQCADACLEIATSNRTVLCRETDFLQDPWSNPLWSQEWYQTEFNAFMNEVALGESFEYPDMADEYSPRVAPTKPSYSNFSDDLLIAPEKFLAVRLFNALVGNRTDRSYTDWLVPSCASDDESTCPSTAPKEQVERLMVNFNNWYASREKIGDVSVGGVQMREEDAQDAKNSDTKHYPKCAKRCQSWCEAACACNWMWDSPWANSEPMGWKNGHAMRFRWNVKFDTWKCLNSYEEPYSCPRDNPSWSIDFINADEHLATPTFLLKCSHLMRLYRKKVCPESMQCDFDCETAAVQVVDFCQENKLLKAIYKNDLAERAGLVTTLNAGIRANCRGSCALRFMGTEQFKEAYPDC